MQQSLNSDIIITGELYEEKGTAYSARIDDDPVPSAHRGLCGGDGGKRLGYLRCGGYLQSAENSGTDFYGNDSEPDIC